MARFVERLRALGIRVPFSAVPDVLDSLQKVDISRIQVFRDVLRCQLIHRVEDWPVFDQAFHQFWFQDICACQHGVESDQSNPTSQCIGDADRHRNDSGKPDLSFRETISETGDHSHTWLQKNPDCFSYSPHAPAHENHGKIEDPHPNKKTQQVIAELLRRFFPKSSRRYQCRGKGNQLALRKLFRKNLLLDGDPIYLPYQRPKTKPRKVVFFCDISGSMDTHYQLMIQYIYAFVHGHPGTEFFFFSTELTRFTHRLRNLPISRLLDTISRQVKHWSGGTRTGYCLSQFHRQFGHRWRLNRRIAVIFSDGWDCGDADLLHDQMELLSRSFHRIIWLNPLSGTRDYKPLSTGMRVALPFCDVFLPADDISDLVVFTKILHKMMGFRHYEKHGTTRLDFDISRFND